MSMIVEVLEFWLFYYAGVLYLLLISWRMIFSAAVMLFRKFFPLDFAKEYGPESFALITGATNGIGKQMAFSLCQKGVNVIIVGRDSKKLVETKKELTTAHPTRKVVTIQKDFRETMSEWFHKDLCDQTRHLDVSIVINNVGISYSPSQKSDLFIELKEPSQILEMIYVNILSYTLNHFYFYNRFRERNHSSLFLDVSSVASLQILPLSNIYGCTKGFNNYLTKSLAYINNNKRIHYLSFTPGSINTTLLNQLNSELKASLPFALETQTAVEEILKFCGLAQLSAGHILHEFVYSTNLLINLVSKLWVFQIVLNQWKRNYLK